MARHSTGTPGHGPFVDVPGRAGCENGATMAARVESRTARRAGVFRRALRREASRLHDGRRILAIVILICVGGTIGAGIIARGDAAGADAHAYWAAVRIWLNGGDPYHPTGPFLPYVYAPWLLPLSPRGRCSRGTSPGSSGAAARSSCSSGPSTGPIRRRPLATAVVVLLLAFPIGANLDTGNITLYLAFMLWGAQFAGPRLAGILWALATWMKWFPAFYWIILAPRPARGGSSGWRSPSC